MLRAPVSRGREGWWDQKGTIRPPSFSSLLPSSFSFFLPSSPQLPSLSLEGPRVC